MHHYNSTQYCNTETVFIYIPFLQTNITSKMWPTGGKGGVWKPGQYTTLAPWYPPDGRLGLTRPNQPASHVSKNRELWLPFLPRLVSQSEVRTSLGQGDGRPGCGWQVLFTWGFATHAQDVFEPLAEWFYTTEYISSASLAFRDPRRRIVVVLSN